MTMFVNLHSLPAGQHMYTAFLAHQDPGTDEWEPGDEIDFVASSRLNGAELAVAVLDTDDWELYDAAETRVAGIADQSTGEILLDRRPELGMPVEA